MIYVCCREAERAQEERRVAKKFMLKEISDNLEDASEVIVIGVPDVRMQDVIECAEREKLRIRYENQEYLQKKIMYALLASRAEIKNMELEQELDIDKFLGIDELE